MFWSLVLPFKIAVAMSVAIVAIAYVAARKYGWRRLNAGFVAIFLAGLLFVPGCIVADMVIAPFRFGHFTAADTESVGFTEVKWYLPPHAKEIDMITSGGGFHARYSITEADLVEWMDESWTRYGSQSPLARSEAAFGTPTRIDSAKGEFDRLDIKTDAHYLLFEGPYAGNWAGSQIWYDAKTATAWQRTGYW